MSAAVTTSQPRTSPSPGTARARACGQTSCSVIGKFCRSVLRHLGAQAPPDNQPPSVRSVSRAPFSPPPLPVRRSAACRRPAPAAASGHSSGRRFRVWLDPDPSGASTNRSRGACARQSRQDLPPEAVSSTPRACGATLSGTRARASPNMAACGVAPGAPSTSSAFAFAGSKSCRRRRNPLWRRAARVCRDRPPLRGSAG